MKKIKCFILITLMLIFLIGCNKNSHDKKIQNTNIDFHYESEISTDNIQIDDVLSFSTFGENIILTGYSILKGETVYINGVEIPVVMSNLKSIYFDNKGKLINEIIIDTSNENCNAEIGAYDKNGDFWAVYLYPSPILTHYSKEGKYIENITLNDFDYYFMSNANFVIDNDMNFYFYEQNKLSVYDNNGSLIFSNTHSDGGFENGGVFKLFDGSIITKKFDNDGTKKTISFNEIDLSKKSFGSEYITNSTTNGNSYLVGGNNRFDLFESSPMNILGYDIKTDKKVELLNWAQYDIDWAKSDLYTKLAYADNSDDIFAIVYDDINGNNSDGRIKLIRFIATPGLLLPKITIKLSAIHINEFTDFAIAKFNGKNKKYNIEVKEYFDGDWDNYDKAINNFNLDIISGNLADVYFLDRSLPVNNFISKGLFADLYEYMDNDDEFVKSDYFENIFKIFEKDDKLYRITPSFCIGTVVGKSSDVGNNLTWDWNEFNSLLATKSNDIIPISDQVMDMTKGSYIYTMSVMMIPNFVDFQNGKCDFNNDDFKNILKLSDRFPSETSKQLSVNKIYEINDYMAGNPLLMRSDIANLMDVIRTRIYFSDDDITYVGMPVNDKNKSGSVLFTMNTFAISEKINDIEIANGAWEFCKFLLTDYQETATNDNIIGSIYGFPIKISVFDKLIADAKINCPMALNLTGELKNISIGGGTFKPEELILTDKDEIKIRELISSLTNIDDIDDNILMIISEESEYYFYNQRTAEEVAEIIQNRVSVYLSEMS